LLKLLFGGGLDAEREERTKYKKEEEDKHLANHMAFKDMIDKYKKEAEEERAQKALNNPAGEEENKLDDSLDSQRPPSIATSKLSTYNSEDNPSSPRSISSANKKVGDDSAELSGDDLKRETSSDQISDQLSEEKGESRRESVDSIDRKNNILKDVVKDSSSTSSNTQFDELD